MDDTRHYLSLRTADMLREIARKWWRIEIGLADASGRVLEEQWGPVPSGGNDFCRAVRSTGRGRKRCFRSVREMHKAFGKSNRPHGPLTHTCHLGLTMVAGAVRAQGRFRGLLFTCGFSSRELSRTRTARLRDDARALLGRGQELPGQRVPVLYREDLERLRDLLEYSADEMAAYDTDQRSIDAPPRAGPASGGAQAFGRIVAHSEEMGLAVDRLLDAAGLSTPVLLIGEAGTGKRALARALHLAGSRRDEPFNAFEGSPDPQATENRLFGQARGGSLGRTGLIEATRGGTLYLSASAWAAETIQVKLLRYMQEGTLVPVGASQAQEADSRLVLAQQQAFETAVAEGALRRDLADFLAPHLVAVPPLRRRRADMEALIALLLERHDLAYADLPGQTADLLLRYHWPGNASELEEELRQLATLSDRDGGLGPSNVSVRIRQAAGYGSRALTKALGATTNIKDAVAILEREMIQEGLIRTRWNKSLLARQLGISRSSLLAKLARYELRDREKDVGRN